MLWDAKLGRFDVYEVNIFTPRNSQNVQNIKHSKPSLLVCGKPLMDKRYSKQKENQQTTTKQIGGLENKGATECLQDSLT